VAERVIILGKICDPVVTTTLLCDGPKRQNRDAILAPFKVAEH